MMPFAVATPETENVKKAHRKKTLDLEDAFAEKASFLRVSEGGNPTHDDESKSVTETITVQETTR